MSTSDRLTVIQGMLKSMDTLTLAGQRHSIIKIVGVLEDEIALRDQACGEPEREAIAALLRSLRSEAKRLMPDRQSFTQSAALLVTAIAAAAEACPGSRWV